MIYRLYCSSGNTLGLDDCVEYYEIDEMGHWVRELQINASGESLRYSRRHAADHLGALPEGVWNQAEAEHKKYGTVLSISRELFESAWGATLCDNDFLHA